MESIVLFDPSIRSLNMGDHIIMDSAERELSEIIRGRYVVKCGTHSPVVTFYQNTRRNPRMRFYDQARYKFVCGSNLLWRRLSVPRPTFNINPFNCMPYEGCVLLGVGTDSKPNPKPMDAYTRRLYKKILSREYVHSTRDETTKEIVESLGLHAINTGCPTMWGFTPEFCERVPSAKAENVVFTITDYSRDPERDKAMIRTLKASYRDVYMWLQGAFDEEYLDELGESDGIRLVSPTLEAYSMVLGLENIEYVGTRLHAGMYALQHRRRTLIITVDNRVRTMKETYGINCIERSDIDELGVTLRRDMPTRMAIDSEAIEQWKGQFEKGPVYYG